MISFALYRPIRSSRISQKFGENKACVTNAGKIVGARNNICPTGSRPYYNAIGMKGHNGLDYPAIEGEAIVHAGVYDGWMRTEVDPAGGIGVDVISNEPLFFAGKPPAGLSVPTFLLDGEEGYASHVQLRYWHLKTPIGYDGKPVTHGQIIGLAGNTGASSGPHLHFGFKYCDKDGNALLKGNGYNGAFDPLPYMTDLFAGDRMHPVTPIASLTPLEEQQFSQSLSALTRVLLYLRELAYRL